MANQNVFAQIMSLGHRETFQRCVERYHGDAYIKTFSCRDQWLAMAFAQLTFRDSLRDLEAALNARPELLYQMGFRSRVARSTLADANEVRDWHTDAQLACASNEQQSKFLEDAAVAGCVGVGQSAARDRAAETEVIELLLTRSQAVLQITQAFPKGEQREREREQVIPRGERRGLIVTSILRDDASKIALRKEVDDLREDETSRMHENVVYLKSGPKRLKSEDFIRRLSPDDSKIPISHQAEIAARILAA